MLARRKSTSACTSSTCASPPSTCTVVDGDASDEEDNCGEGLERISTSSALDYLEKLKKFCLQSGCSDDIMSPFDEFSDLLEKHIASRKSHRTITDFFRAMQKEKGYTDDVEDRFGEAEREEWMNEDSGGKRKERRHGRRQRKGRKERRDGRRQRERRKERRDGRRQRKGKKERWDERR